MSDAPPPHRNYWAFISYSQLDTQWGKWLHRALEQYRVPARLVDQPTERGYKVPKRVFPVFLDREELPTSSNFGRMIEDALESSKYLIVICSPRSAKSKWVNEEILAYKRLGREDRILCLIVDGEPNASDSKLGFDPELECFAPALRFKLGGDGDPTEHRLEPLAADARPGRDGKTNAQLKILAGILGVAYDDLVRRDHARRMRRMWSITVVSLVLMTVMAALAVLFLVERNRAEDALGARYELAGREAAFDGEFGESILYYDAAREMGRLVEGDPGFATAWEQCRNLRDQFRTGRAPAFAQFSADGSRLAVQDQLSAVLVRDVTTGKLLWQSEPGTIQGTTRAIGRDAVIGLETLKTGERQLVIRRISNLEVIWSKPWPAEWTSVRNLLLSADGTHAFYQKVPTVPGDEERLAVIDAAADTEAEIEGVQSVNLAEWWFGPEGKYLYHAETEGFTGMAMRVWDTATGKLLAERPMQQPVSCHAAAGDQLLIGFAGGFVGCLQAETLEVIWTWQNAPMPAPLVQLTREEDRVIALDAMQRVSTLDLETGKLASQQTIGRGHAEVAHVVGDSLLSGSQDGVLRFWQGGQLQAMESWHPDALSAVALSPDGRLAFAGALNGIARVWEVAASAGGPSVRVLRPDGAPYRFFHARAQHSGFVHFATDAGLFRLEPHGALARLLDDVWIDLVSSSEGTLVGINAEGEVRFQSPDGELSAPIRPLADLPEAPRHYLVGGGDRVFAVADGQGWAEVSPDTTAIRIQTFPDAMLGKPLAAVRAHPDGSALLVAGFGGAVRWKIDGEAEILPGAELIERVYAWNGDHLLWRSADGSLKLGRFGTDAPETLELQVASATLQEIDGTTVLASANLKGEVTVRTLAGQQISWFQHPRAQSAGLEMLLQNAAQPGGGMVFSPNQRWLVTSHGFHVYLWDWRTGAQVWKSPQLPAGMFGQLFVTEFIAPDRLLINEGEAPGTIGASAAYTLRIPLQTPNPETVATFGRDVLGLEWSGGLLKDIRD